MRKNAPNPSSQAEPWSPNTYQTGSTTPPKSRNGLIAVLLVVVILLCGVVTVLGITNVKLFRILSGQDDSEVLPVFLAGSRSRATSADDASPYEERSVTLSRPLGIEGESVPKVHQLYYCLPCGLYVSNIEPEASAFRRGLQPGDIITHVDGFAIEFEEDFTAALSNYAPGDLVTLTVYRNANTFPVIVEVQPTR